MRCVFVCVHIYIRQDMYITCKSSSYEIWPELSLSTIAKSASASFLVVKIFSLKGVHKRSAQCKSTNERRAAKQTDGKQTDRRGLEQVSRWFEMARAHVLSARMNSGNEMRPSPSSSHSLTSFLSLSCGGITRREPERDEVAAAAFALCMRFRHVWKGRMRRGGGVRVESTLRHELSNHELVQSETTRLARLCIGANFRCWAHTRCTHLLTPKGIT